MRTKLFIAAAAVAVSAVAATAGGLNPVIIETPIVDIVTPAPSSSSGGSLLPILLGVGLVAAIIAADDSTPSAN